MPAPLTEPPVMLTKEMAQMILDADGYARVGNGKWNLTEDEEDALRSLASGATVVVPAQDAADARRFRYLCANWDYYSGLMWKNPSEALEKSIDAALAATHEEKP